MVKPGGHDHPGRQILILSHSAGHHVAYAVNKPHGERDPLLHADLHRLLRNKFGFRRHDGAAGAALRQFIPRPVPAVAIVDIGQHLGLHKPFDKGGFSGAYRTHHADIDTAAGAGRHILINGCGLIHGPFLLLREDTNVGVFFGIAGRVLHTGDGDLGVLFNLCFHIMNIRKSNLILFSVVSQ